MIKRILFNLIPVIFGVLIFHSCQNKPINHQVGYEKKDLSQITFIEQDRHAKAMSFDFDTNDRGNIHTDNEIDALDFSKPLLNRKGQIHCIPDSKRVYFQLGTDKNRTLLAARRLPLEGACDFRDMGGIRTKDGRFVKWGKIFRSDDLLLLTDNDLAYLDETPIIYIVDFRSREEIEKSPALIFEPDRNDDHAFSIIPENLSDSSDTTIFDFQKFKNLDIDSIKIAFNTKLVTDPKIVAVYKDFFDVLQDDLTPLFFHCTAGKDCTGMVSALFLFSLGVDEETVMQDYLLSNKFGKERFASTLDHYPFFAPFAGIQEEYLQAGIDQIKKDHGSIENYLETSLDVDLEKIRDSYLY